MHPLIFHHEFILMMENQDCEVLLNVFSNVLKRYKMVFENSAYI